MTDEPDLIDVIERVVAGYLDDLDDPGEVDSGVLAENIAAALEAR